MMNDAEREMFSIRLNNAAHDNGIWRPTDLARMAGMSPITVAAYMRGTRGATLEACVKLSKTLNCNPWWLFGKDAPKERVVEGKASNVFQATGVNDSALADLPLPSLLAVINYLCAVAAQKAA